MDKYITQVFSPNQKTSDYSNKESQSINDWLNSLEYNYEIVGYVATNWDIIITVQIKNE